VPEGSSFTLTAEEAKQYGLDLDEGWGVEIASAPDTEVGYQAFLVSPTGEKYTAEELEALAVMPEGEINRQSIEPYLIPMFWDTVKWEVAPKDIGVEFIEGKWQTEVPGEEAWADWSDEAKVNAIWDFIEEHPETAEKKLRRFGFSGKEIAEIVPGYKSASLWEKVKSSFYAGVGDIVSATGQIFDWAGADWLGKQAKELGDFMRSHFIPPEDPGDFGWQSVLDPEWWATSVTRAVPFTLSLIPAALVGGVAGVAGAIALGLGSFGRVVLGALGAASVSRPIESAFEAAGAYEQALQQGMSEEEAASAARSTFEHNLALVGMDAVEFAAAFAPLKGGGKIIRSFSNTRLGAITLAGGKITGVGALEAGEEGFQEMVQRRALGEETALDAQMSEAMAIGAIFGMGLGGAGSVWTVLTERVKRDFSPDLRAEYERIKAELIEGGASEAEAETETLNRIAETAEGMESITNTMDELREIATSIEVPEQEPPVLMEIPDSEKILDGIMTDSWQREALRLTAKTRVLRPPIEWVFGKRILVRRQSEAIEDIAGRGKFLHAEVNRKGEGASAVTNWRMMAVDSNPVKLFGFNKQAVAPASKVKRIAEDADGTIEDIFTHPEKYNLTKKQSAYVYLVHRINMAVLKMLEAEGVAPESVTEDWWLKRIVVGKYDPEGELTMVRGRAGVRRGRIGGKKSYEMHRQAPTMAEGIAWGILYGRNPADSVAAFIEEAFSKIADARFEKYLAKELEPLAKMGVLPSEELLRRYPEAVERAVVTAEELADAKAFQDKINRAIRGEVLPKQTLDAIERRFPEHGRRFRALVTEPVTAEKQLRQLLSQTKQVIQALQEQLKQKEIDAAAIQKMERGEVPDSVKLTEAFRLMDYEDRLAFRATMQDQLADIVQMVGEQEAELDSIQEYLRTDPVAVYRGRRTFVTKKGVKRSSSISLVSLLVHGKWPETLTKKQAELVLMGGEILPNVLTLEGRVRWEYVVDELAEHFGMSEQEFINHLESIAKMKVQARDLRVLVKIARDRQEGIKRMVGVLDEVDTDPEFIPQFEPTPEVPESGAPEGGMQQDMFGYAQPVQPKGKGEVTQISMDDYAKLVDAWKAAGLPESELPVAIKPKVEGVKGLEGDTQVVRVSYEVPAERTAKERKAALVALRKEVKDIAEARKIPYWQARAERKYRMEQVKQPGIDEGFIQHPFAQGRKYDQDFIDAFNKFFGHKEGQDWLQPFADVSGLMRIVKAALDFSQPAIQGTLSWGLAHAYLVFDPPKGARMMGAWYKCFFEQIGAFFNPGIMARFMEKNKEMAMQRIACGGSSRAVFFFQEMEAVVGKGRIARMGEQALRAIPLTPYQRAEVAFFTGGEIVRDRFWEILSPKAIEKGKEFELARHLDLVTGIADPRALGVPMTVRQLQQSWILFSMAYTYSYMTLVADIFRGGYSGSMARRAIGGFVVAGSAFFVGIQFAICKLEGMDDDEAWDIVMEGFGIVHDPITGDWSWNPTAKFMSLQIGDTSYGIGGGIYGLMRLLGNVAATINEVGERERIDLIRILKHGSLNKQDNPTIAWQYSRSAALTSTVYELATGRDFLGYPIETPEEYGQYLIKLLQPIWVEQSINPLIPQLRGDYEVPEDALETASWVLGELFGLRVNPEYAWQRFYDVANKYIPRLPVEELDAKQRDAWKDGKLKWAHLTKIQKINLLHRYPELYDAYVEAQADSELRQSDHWKDWTQQQEAERDAYYQSGHSLIERVLAGELDTRELREMWAEDGSQYGTALDTMEDTPAYQWIYDYFEKQKEKGDKYLFEADMVLAEYIEIMFAEYQDEKGDYDWDARDKAIDGFIQKWGADYYQIIREMYSQKRLLEGMHPALVALAEDKDKLGRSYWQLPYKPIIQMDEQDVADGNIPTRYVSLWREYQALETDEAREAFIESHPDLTKDWRAEFRLKNPEADAMLALWGYGGKLQSMEAYDILVSRAAEYGFPLGQLGLGLPPQSLIEPYFEYNKVSLEFGGSSAEARLFRLEHPEWDAWGQEEWGWQEIDAHPEALRLSVEWRGLDAQYDGFGDRESEFYIEDEGQRREARELFLSQNPQYADDRRRRDAYQHGFADEMVETYVEYYKLPTSGYAQEWFLQDNPDFYQAALSLLEWEPKDFSKVPTKEVWGLFLQYEKQGTGRPRLEFRCQNKALDDWLVTAKGYKRVYGTDRCDFSSRPKTPTDKPEWLEEMEEHAGREF